MNTETVTVNGNGTYSTPNGYLPTSAGTYQWVVTYSGDSNNNSVSSSKGSEPETVTREIDDIEVRWFPIAADAVDAFGRFMSAHGEDAFMALGSCCAS